MGNNLLNYEYPQCIENIVLRLWWNSKAQSDECITACKWVYTSMMTHSWEILNTERVLNPWMFSSYLLNKYTCEFPGKINW